MYYNIPVFNDFDHPSKHLVEAHYILPGDNNREHRKVWTTREDIYA